MLILTKVQHQIQIKNLNKENEKQFYIWVWEIECLSGISFCESIEEKYCERNNVFLKKLSVKPSYNYNVYK